MACIGTEMSFISKSILSHFRTAEIVKGDKSTPSTSQLNQLNQPFNHSTIFSNIRQEIVGARGGPGCCGYQKGSNDVLPFWLGVVKQV
jgi:hypothetical protein